MSVTFVCPDAPRKEVPCEWCERYRAESPELLVDGKCDRYCRGVEQVSDAPEINLSNASAGDILDLLELGNPAEPWGELAVEDIPVILQRIMRILARSESRKHLLAEGSVSQEPRMGINEDGLPAIELGPKVIYGGVADEQIVRRVTSIRTLLVWAAEHNHKVSWG